MEEKKAHQEVLEKSRKEKILKAEADHLSKALKAAKDNEKFRKETNEIKNAEIHAKYSQMKKDKIRAEKDKWDDLLIVMKEEEKQKAAEEKVRKEKEKEIFEQRQTELKGAADSKAATAARKEKEVQIKIVADLLLHDQKIQEKSNRKAEALNQVTSMLHETA